MVPSLITAAARCWSIRDSRVVPQAGNCASFGSRSEGFDDVIGRLGDEPTDAEQIVSKITGEASDARSWSYRECRTELLLALLDQDADSFDKSVEELGRVVDHLPLIRPSARGNRHPHP